MPDLSIIIVSFNARADLERCLESISAPARMAPFDVTFGGVGVFPPRGAPRVLWIGIADGAAHLERLQHEIAERVRAAGIAFDDRPFHPHLTVGRWRGTERRRSSAARRSAPERLRRDLAALDGSDRIACVSVTRATLYRSRLSSSGPAYTALAHANLSDSE